MCTNYVPSEITTIREKFKADFGDLIREYRTEAYKDYLAPIIVAGEGGARRAEVANYSMVPKAHLPPDAKKYSTMNARSETVGQLRSYAGPWKAGQLCLVPMKAFYEPCYETGSAVRWRIGMADDSDFAVAGLWRTWNDADGSISHAFTQLTINADSHPLMRRFHKPEDEKRSLVVVPEDDFDAWLNCRDTELARSFLRLFPSELMSSMAEPTPPRTKKAQEAAAIS
jgi:putative SOS response-associated peptidase YedK